MREGNKCKNGHELNSKNTYEFKKYLKKTDTYGTYLACKLCRGAADKRLKLKIKEQEKTNKRM